LKELRLKTRKSPLVHTGGLLKSRSRNPSPFIAIHFAKTPSLAAQVEQIPSEPLPIEMRA
jgi:hypothetical protein